MAHITETATAKGTAYNVHWRPQPGKFAKKRFYIKREAERFKDKVERELAEGQSTQQHVTRGMKFRDVAERMMDAERPRLKQKTIDGYEIAFRAHVYPALGSRHIGTIKATDLDAFNAAMRAKPKANGQPRSETSVLGAYKAVARVMRYAYNHRLIPFNPCVAVARPKADTEEARFLSIEQVNALAAQLATQPPFDLLVRFAALTGLRIGEVAALQIKHINMLRGEVLVRLNKTHTSKGYVTGTPKSMAGRRDVPILDEVLFRDIGMYLRSHPKAGDPEAGLWPGKVPGHNRLSYDREFDPKGFYRYTFKPACERAGLAGLHFHELRHTFATMALTSRAMTMYELSVAMGHESEGVTNKIYAHYAPRDYSSHRAAFSAHVATAVAPPTPLRQLSG